jgi:hypothetical protein
MLKDILIFDEIEQDFRLQTRAKSEMGRTGLKF